MQGWQWSRMAALRKTRIVGPVWGNGSALGFDRLGSALRSRSAGSPVKVSSRATAGALSVTSRLWIIEAKGVPLMGSPRARSSVVGRASAFAAASRKT